jgi:hypothetical protein
LSALLIQANRGFKTSTTVGLVRYSQVSPVGEIFAKDKLTAKHAKIREKVKVFILLMFKK